MAGERLSLRCAYCAYETTLAEEAHENWRADDGAKIFGLCPFFKERLRSGMEIADVRPENCPHLNSAMGKVIGEYRRRS
jgi:hypothetical protein